MPILPFACCIPTRQGRRRGNWTSDFADPDTGGNPLAATVWPATRDATILPVWTTAAPEGGPDTLDLLSLPVEAVIWREQAGHEHLVIADGSRRIRLEATGASVAHGPVFLRYDLAGFQDLRPRLAALHRLEALKRLGRLPRNLFGRDPVAIRWTTALAAWDLRKKGASHLDIAIALFGARDVHADSIDRVRKRVARLLHLAERRMAAGYRRFLVK